MVNYVFTTTFKRGENANTDNIRYLVVNASSPNNIIISNIIFNVLEAVLSTLYLTMKYPRDNGQIRGDKGR